MRDYEKGNGAKRSVPTGPYFGGTLREGRNAEPPFSSPRATVGEEVVRGGLSVGDPSERSRTPASDRVGDRPGAVLSTSVGVDSPCESTVSGWDGPAPFCSGACRHVQPPTRRRARSVRGLPPGREPVGGLDAVLRSQHRRHVATEPAPGCVAVVGDADGIGHWWCSAMTVEPDAAAAAVGRVSQRGLHDGDRAESPHEDEQQQSDVEVHHGLSFRSGVVWCLWHRERFGTVTERGPGKGAPTPPARPSYPSRSRVSFLRKCAFTSH